MELLQEDINRAEATSFIEPIQEYGQSDIGALAESMNSFYARMKRVNYDKEAVDVTKYQDTTFNNDTYLQALGEEEDPTIRQQLGTSNINTWEQYEKRKRYLTHYNEVQEQVSSNFSTAGMLALGIPLSLIDEDMLLINPTLAGVGKVNKALNLQTRMSKVASHAVAGSLVGAESMVMYENATGVYNDDSITNSALMGMVLGGSLGMFIERAGSPKDKWKDSTDSYVDATKVKEEALNKAKGDLAKTEEALNIQKHIEDNVKLEKGSIKQQLTALVKDTTQQLKTLNVNRTKLVKQTKQLVKDVASLSKNTEAIKALDGEITELEFKIYEAKATGKPYKKLEISLNSRKKKFDAIQGSPNRTKLKHYLASKEKQLRAKTKVIQDNNTIISNSNKEKIQLENKLDTSIKAVKEHKKKPNTKAEEYLNKDKFKQLLDQRGLLTSSIADIEANKLDLLGLTKEKQNYVNKLTKELEDNFKTFTTLESIGKNKVVQSLPKWAQKMLISPIEKVLHSENKLVAGFGALLHSGTIHHGKVQTDTAYRARVRRDEQLSTTTRAIRHAYSTAKSDGYTKSMEEFELEVNTEAINVIDKLQREATQGLPATMDEIARSEAVIKKMSSLSRKYVNGNKHIQKAVDEILDYYEDIAKQGKVLELEAFKHTTGKGYLKRVYSRDKILAVGKETAIDNLVQAQKAYREGNGLPIDEVMLAEMRGKATTAVESTLNRENIIRSITEPFSKPIKTTTSAFKQRTIEVYDGDIRAILDDDIVGNMHTYGLSTHGRLAIKEKLGVNNQAELDDVLGKLGANTEELDNIRVITETILGTREITKNPFDPVQVAIKAVSSYSSLMHTGAFGVPTLTEVASIAKEFGWGNTMKHLIPSAKEIKDIYLKGTPSDKNSIELLAQYGDPYFANKANRHDVENAFEATNRIQEKIDGTVHKLSFLGGLLPITDTLKMTTISASVDFLASMSVKGNISPTDIKRLGDMGFDANDLKNIRDTLKVGSDGRINNMDRKTWGKLDRQITDGVMTMVERTILHPNGATLPKFMTNMDSGAILSKVIMKFMRFPVESYERLLIRGIQEADAKQMIALGGNIAMWTMILSAKDALKDEEKQQYNGDEGTTKLVTDSLLYNSWTAFPVAMSDKMYGAVTGENLTNNYRHRVFGVIESDLGALQDANPRFSIPGYNVNLGDTTSRIVNDLGILDDLSQEN